MTPASIHLQHGLFTRSRESPIPVKLRLSLFPKHPAGTGTDHRHSLMLNEEARASVLTSGLLRPDESGENLSVPRSSDPVTKNEHGIPVTLGPGRESFQFLLMTPKQKMVRWCGYRPHIPVASVQRARRGISRTEVRGKVVLVLVVIPVVVP